MQTETIRSFLAIALPDELKRKITTYTSSLSKYAGKLRWTNAQNLHLTLKFLGEQQSEKIDALIAELSSNPLQIPSFKLDTTNLGAFPNIKRPRVIWLGVESTPQNSLFKLRNQIENRCKLLGFEKENKKFNAHLTISRVKFPMDLDEMWEFTKQNVFSEYRFEVDKFVLMKSTLKPSGAEYRVLQNFPLHKK